MIRLYAQYDHVPDDQLEKYLFEEMRFKKSLILERGDKKQEPHLLPTTSLKVFKSLLNVACLALIVSPTILSRCFLVGGSFTEADVILFGVLFTFPILVAVCASTVGLVYLFYPKFLLNFGIMDKDMIHDRINKIKQ